jgi:hypothetical protein
VLTKFRKTINYKYWWLQLVFTPKHYRIMADATPSPLDSINAAAEQVRAQLKLKSFNAEAVAHLANFIEAQRAELGPADRPGVIMALGCFLGHCLVQVYRANGALAATAPRAWAWAEDFFSTRFIWSMRN